MSTTAYVTGRMTMELKSKEEAKEIGLGELVAEMIKIGDPTKPTSAGRRGVSERFELLKNELDRRWEELKKNKKLGRPKKTKEEN